MQARLVQWRRLGGLLTQDGALYSLGGRNVRILPPPNLD
jgi:hypothetical protein